MNSVESAFNTCQNNEDIDLKMLKAVHLKYRRQKTMASRLVTAGVLTLMLCLPAYAERQLNIFTWSEYIDPDVVKEFEELYDARVEFSYFESDRARDEKLVAVAAQGFDLFLVNSTQVERYGKRGWLAPIDWNLVPNSENIDTKWMTAFNGVETYAVPYFWGTMGIAYRKDMIPQGFTSWMDLLEPIEELEGKILMVADSRELTAIALKSANFPVNTNDSRHLRQARNLLMAQKPFVKGYAYPSLDEQSIMSTGEIWAATMYSGDVLMLQEHDDHIAYSIPEEGALLWIDYLTIAQTSQNKVLAHQFLNFINRADIAARLAEWVYYASPNLAAVPLISEEHKANKTIHPDANTLDKSEFIRPIAPRTSRTINNIGAELFRDFY